MDHSPITNNFITNYLTQLEYNDFVPIMNKIKHKHTYIATTSHQYFAKNNVMIHDVISKLDDHKKDEFIKKIMNQYPDLTISIIENDFLDKINWEKYVPFISDSVMLKCMEQNPTVLSRILAQPTDVQKIIIDRYLKNNTKDDKDDKDDKNDFVIVNNVDNVHLEEHIVIQVDKTIKTEKILWDTYSIRDLTDMFDESYHVYNTNQTKPITMLKVNKITRLGIRLIALNEYIERKKDEKLDKETKLKKENELWDTLSLVELHDMHNKEETTWKAKGGRTSCDKKTELKLLRMSQYIGHKGIEERYKNEL